MRGRDPLERAGPDTGRKRRSGRAARSAAAAILAALASGAGADESKRIGVTLTASPAVVEAVRPGDRLVLKLAVPQGGVDHDPKYDIRERWSLPLEVVLVPNVDMAGKTRFEAYRVEAYTDRDGDLLSLVPGELVGVSDDLVPLGTTGLRLELRPVGR